MADATTVMTMATSGIVNVIGAAGGLGTAAYGLVDVTKIARGGVSNAGFKYITSALKPFESALQVAAGPHWDMVLKSNWINGVAKDQQKAIAKSLIRLGLAAENAAAIATAGHVNAAALSATLEKLAAGEELSPPDINLLGRLDVSIGVALDMGYEHADQVYRNSSKALAALFAVALALWGGALLANASGVRFTLHDALTATLIGLISVPLAPIAKDLSSAIQAAVKAVQSTRR